MTPRVTREQAVEALLAKLQTVATFKTVTRRNRRPDTILAAATPALMLLEHSDAYPARPSNAPPVRRLMLRAMIYVDTGNDQNAVPSAILNPILDAIDAALAPDDPARGQCTLGGLVQSVVIAGTIIRAPGDVTGKSLAAVPLEILLP